MAERHFVVVENISRGGVLAYTRGQVITDEQVVTDNGWEGLVAAKGTKAAAEVQAEVSGLDVAEFITTRASAKSTSSDSATATEQKG